jgi:hypothetical protein
MMQLVRHSKRMKSLCSVMGRVLSTNGNEWSSRSALASPVFRANEQLQSNCSSFWAQWPIPRRHSQISSTSSLLSLIRRSIKPWGTAKNDVREVLKIRCPQTIKVRFRPILDPLVFESAALGFKRRHRGRGQLIRLDQGANHLA